VPKLTERGLKTLAKTPGRHRDGSSALYLWVRSPTARYWTYRYRLNGRQTELGLGPYPEVTLDQARALYAEKHAMVANGVDPIAAKRARRLAKAPAASAAPTFGEIVDRYIESHRDEWRSSRHHHQWEATTGPGSYCEPIRSIPIDRLTTAIIHDPLGADLEAGARDRLSDPRADRGGVGLRQGARPYRRWLRQSRPVEGSSRAPAGEAAEDRPPSRHALRRGPRLRAPLNEAQ
jgi:hypothetical protein